MRNFYRIYQKLFTIRQCPFNVARKRWLLFANKSSFTKHNLSVSTLRITQSIIAQLCNSTKGCNENNVVQFFCTEDVPLLHHVFHFLNAFC